MSDAIWQSERRLWLEGSNAYVELLHPECIVVFGEPIGIIKAMPSPKASGMHHGGRKWR